ncbi:MAG TPA: lipopolysaccharide heptosyltransferase II [bacterium]|nr:lipopolysaccharide heptosyltransferase II [bacterium]HPN43999.1 lipopolysaccharide heptosyltransferase II [bacterium]
MHSIQTTVQSSPKRILIIRLSSIGDIILATPVPRNLKNKFPAVELDFIVKKQFAALLHGNPYIDHILPLDTGGGRRELARLKNQLQARNYDLVVDIHNNLRSHYLKAGLPGIKVTYKKYAFRRFLLVKFGWNLFRTIIPVTRRYLDSLATFGITDDRLGPQVFIDPTTLQRMDKLLQDKGLETTRPVICMAPGAGFFTKRWPVEYFTQIAECCIKVLNAQIVLLGNTQDQQLTRQIIIQLADKSALDLAGTLEIMETAAVMNRADLVVSNDSGLMHLAAALKKKTVAVFGSTTRELGFFPDNPLARVMENNDLPCRPCSHIGRKKCPKQHFKCMRDILPDTVFQAVRELLKNE